MMILTLYSVPEVKRELGTFSRKEGCGILQKGFSEEQIAFALRQAASGMPVIDRHRCWKPQSSLEYRPPAPATFGQIQPFEPDAEMK